MKYIYTLELLTKFCEENKVKLLEDYSNEKLIGKTYIKGICSNEDCDNIFEKLFKTVISSGGMCLKCSSGAKISYNYKTLMNFSKGNNIIICKNYETEKLTAFSKIEFLCSKCNIKIVKEFRNLIKNTICINCTNGKTKTLIDLQKACNDNNVEILSDLKGNIETKTKTILKCKCKCGEIFEKTILSIIKFPKCKECINKINKESNLIKDRYPEIFLTLDKTKNIGIDIYSLTIGNSQLLWWNCPNSKCEHPHTFQTFFETRLNGNCPFCSKSKVCFCYSISNDEKLSKEFHLTLNRNINPNEIWVNSSIPIFWKCSNHTSCNNHIWKTSCYMRTTEKTECPYCANVKMCECSDTLANYPELLEELDTSVHLNLDPSKISIKLKKTFSWICKNHKSCNLHKFETTVYNRIIKNAGCPYCSNHRTCECNHIFCDEVFKLEFDSIKNVDIDPYNITLGSGTNIWWSCSECKKSWESSPLKRNSTSLCPYCCKSTSKLEYNCKTILLKHNINFLIQQKLEKCSNRVYDFKINYNNKNFIIELDGGQHFKKILFFNITDEKFEENKKIDILKNTNAINCGYNIIRICTLSQNVMEKILLYFLNLENKKLFIGFENSDKYNKMSNPDNYNDIENEFDIIFYEEG